MPDRAFYEALPSKRMGAGCLFFNTDGEVLLLKPTYKEGWEIPGGVVEDNESPKTCCEREVLEELGLEISIRKLLVLDYNSYPHESHKTESLMFIFEGGVLTDHELANLQLQADEISTWQCFAVENLPESMNSSLRERIIQAIKHRENQSFAYLENQQIV